MADEASSLPQSLVVQSQRVPRLFQPRQYLPPLHTRGWTQGSVSQGQGLTLARSESNCCSCSFFSSLSSCIQTHPLPVYMTIYCSAHQLDCGIATLLTFLYLIPATLLFTCRKSSFSLTWVRTWTVSRIFSVSFLISSFLSSTFSPRSMLLIFSCSKSNMWSPSASSSCVVNHC